MRTRKIVLFLSILSVLCVGGMVVAEPLWGDRLESKVDVIDGELSQCCEETNSKLDVIDIKIDALPVSENDVIINSKLDVVDDELSQCCEETNSKLDVIDNKIDALPVSENDVIINSKLDVVDDELSQCCEETNSKLDVIDGKIDALPVSENDVIINSKLDVVDSELSTCCVAVNAKIDTIDGKVETVLSTVAALTDCGLQPLSSSDISSGIITIASAGTYCLTQDVTATFTITADCVVLSLNDRIVIGSIVIGADDVIIESGSLKPTAAAGLPAVEVSGIADRAELRDLFILCASQTSPAAGLDGIQINGTGWEVWDCTVIAGAGNGDGNDGGSAIVVGGSSVDTVITDCFLRGGAGGNSSSATAGGNGGHGIDVVSSATLVEISDCLIQLTGDGGANSSSGAGGNGGHGINIASGCADVSVHNCTIRDTGAGGSGTPNGAGGKAIVDLVPDGVNKSIVVGNLAYLIDNSTKFDLLGTGTEGIEINPFPPDNTQTNMNQWGNYFVA